MVLAASHDRRHQLHRVRAGENGPDAVLRRIHAAADRQRGLDEAAQDRQPGEPREQLGAARQLDLGPKRRRLDIDDRLIHAVEQDQAVGADAIELAREMCRCREKHRQLDGQRDP